MAFEFELLYSFRNPPNDWYRDQKQVYDEIIDHIVTMEQIGYDVISTTEHHFSEDGYLPQLAVMTAALAMKTERVILSQGIIEAPLHHPVALAEQLAVCDILSGGRLRVGVGMGRMDDWRPSYAHEGLTFGAPLTAKDRAPMFEEHVQVMRRCWQPGPFKHSGTYYDFPEIDVTPKPLQVGGPDVFFGVGPAPAALRRAARLGNGLNNGVAAIVPYLKEVEALGRMTEAGKVSIVAPHYPARDPERAEAMFGAHIDYLWQWYKMPANPWPAPHFLEPAEVASELREAKDLGATGAWWFAPFSGAVPAETVEIYETIINDVKPLVESEQPAAL